MKYVYDVVAGIFQNQDLEILPSLLHRCTDHRTWANLHCFSRCISKELDGKWSILEAYWHAFEDAGTVCRGLAYCAMVLTPVHQFLLLLLLIDLLFSVSLWSNYSLIWTISCAFLVMFSKSFGDLISGKRYSGYSCFLSVFSSISPSQ